MLKVFAGARIAPKGMSDPAPTSASSKKFHGWDETVPQGSVYLVSIYFIFLGLFFPS
jgi:hypothetical protein